MPFPSDNRGTGPPNSQPHSMRMPIDGSGMVGPRSQPHQLAPPPYAARDYHIQSHRIGNMPPHYSERLGRNYIGYNQAINYHPGDEDISQYPLPRRGPPSPSRAEAAGAEGPQHVHVPVPPNGVRRGSFSYGQGFYQYSDYNRPPSPSVSPSNGTRMPPVSMREGEMSRRFVPRPMSGQDIHYMMTTGDSRHVSRNHFVNQSDLPRRYAENWRGEASFDSDYGNNLRPPQEEQHDHQYTSQQSPQQYRGTNSERVFRSPQGMLTQINNFEQEDGMRIPYERSKSDNSEDDVSRSNDEHSSSIKDEMLMNLGCTCKKSKCLKLYCQCFATRSMCVSTCRCISCQNLPHFELERKEAIHSILMRNPNAFETKFKAATEGKTSEVTHKLGCKCRKSACLKKYCECYHADAKCNKNCRCVGCQNMPDGGPHEPFSRQDNHLPETMIDAARDLAVLKTRSPSMISTGYSERQVSGTSDLYLVPTLTSSDTKEDEVDENKNYQKPNQRSGSYSNASDKGTKASAVDMLLSAAYALTELGSSHLPVTPSQTNKKTIVTPSPKRLLDDDSYVQSIPSKRACAIAEISSPVSSFIIKKETM